MISTIALFGVLAGSGTFSVSGDVVLRNGKEARQAVVSLVGDVRSHAMKHAVVDQRDKTFLPHISVVTVGTTVDFPNHDVIFHNVFTEYHSTRFDFGMYPRGTTKHQTFDRVGLAVLLCSVHPNMSAYVMVVDTPYFAVADRSGHFKIDGVQPGRYRVDVWQESGEKSQATLTVDGDKKVHLQTHR